MLNTPLHRKLHSGNSRVRFDEENGVSEKPRSSSSSCKKKCFRLISIYIGNFGCFHKEIFNFCSDYTMVREPDQDGKLRLKVTHKKVLPDNFFSLSGKGESCVDSISAIIGKNGTGKSTIARLLCNLPHDNAKEKDENTRWGVIVVYEVDEELYGYSTTKEYKIFVEGDGRKINLDNEGLLLTEPSKVPNNIMPGKPYYRFFYFSPYYTTEQSAIDFSNDDVANISTTYLMCHPSGNSEFLLRQTDEQDGNFGVKDEAIAKKRTRRNAFLPICRYWLKFRHLWRDVLLRVRGFAIASNDKSGNSHEPSLKVDISHLSVFGGDEMIRVFEFLAEFKRTLEGQKFSQSDFEMPLPSGMIMTVRKDGLMQAIRQLAPENDVKLAGIKGFVSNFKAANEETFVAIAFVAYALQYIGHNGVSSVTYWGRHYSKDYLKRLTKFLSEGNWNKNKYPSGADIVKFFKDVRPGIFENPPKDEIDFTALLFRNLLELKNESKNQNGTVRYVPIFNEFYFPFGDEQLQKKVYELISLHSKVKGIGVSFLKFDPFPRMSSGQMSFISLFARLYQFVKKGKTEGNPNRPVVLFLDEAETTLHPEWQRRLVSYLIRFLNVFIPERRYQLIFASHSPTLLSDIPKGNCVFLQEDRENNQNGKPLNKSVSFRGKEGECGNTFGANIYDLYHNAFFLEHGAIGEFAEAKIQDALKAVKNVATTEAIGGENSNLNENIGKLMDLVGDRILQRYFQRLKDFGLIKGAGVK